MTPTDEQLAEMIPGNLGEGRWPSFVTLFWHFGKQQRLSIIGGITSQLLVRFPDAGLVYLIGIAFDALFNDQPFKIPIVPISMIPSTEIGQLWFTVGAVVVLVVLTTALNYVNDRLWDTFAQRMQHDLRIATYATVQSRDMGFFDDRDPGDLMSVLTNDVENFGSSITECLQRSIRVVGFVLGTLLFLLLLSPQLTIVALAVAPIIGAVNYWFSQRLSDQHANVQSSLGLLNARLETNVNGIKVVKAYEQERRESDRIESSSWSYSNARLTEIKTRMTHYPVMRVLTGVGFTLTFAVGGYWVLNGSLFGFASGMTVGTLIPFVFYTRNLMWPMQSVPGIVDRYNAAEASADRIIDIGCSAKDLDRKSSDVSFTQPNMTITFQNVTFRYDGTTTVFDGVDLSFEPQKTVGVVGPTGAGKSTLVKLLLQFYEADEGEIFINDIRACEMTKSEIRSAIGYVSQHPYIFPGTVRENIHCGRDEIDDARIEKVAKQVGAHEFVEKFEDGYDTLLGPNGVHLSGGQRQRIELARSLYADPPILVLDEAMNGIDNMTAASIRAELESIIEDRLAIVIAHRLPVVKTADRILTLEDGDIIEDGTHEELLDAGGAYANLWNVQVGRNVAKKIEQRDD